MFWRYNNAILREISIYISHFAIFSPMMTKLEISKIMRAVLSSEIDTYGSNRPNKNSTSQRYSFGVIQISIWNSNSKNGGGDESRLNMAYIVFSGPIVNPRVPPLIPTDFYSTKGHCLLTTAPMIPMFSTKEMLSEEQLWDASLTYHC